MHAQSAGKQFQQRGLAGAVRADEHNALAAFGFELNAPVNHGRVVGIMDVLQLDDAVAAALRLREMKMDTPAFLDRCFDLVHPLDLFELGLRLCRLAGLGAEAVGKILELLDFLLLVFVGRQQLHFVGLALDEVFVVIAPVPVQLRLPDFDDAADEFIQEGPVMRNQQNRAGIILQIFLKPLQCAEVEMVGRLVEQEQVRLLHQQSGEIRAHHPSAAHRLGRPVEIPFSERQPAEDRLGARFELVAAEFVEARLHLVKIV